MPDTSTPPEGSILSPTLADLEGWDPGSGVAVDLECAGSYLRGIGFCNLDNLKPIWVPFRRKGGTPYWGEGELVKAVEWCDSILSSPILKVFHNGYGFDVPYLRRLGFQVNPPIDDTMMLAHVFNPEAPKGLQWLCTNYLGLPVWKDLIGADEESAEGKG